jgi:hypothetical protein
VAAIKGQDEDWARKLAARTGDRGAPAALNKLVTAPPDRPDLGRLYRDARAVLDDRHVLVHSMALADMDARDEPGSGIWHPRTDTEARITAAQSLDHAHDIRIVVRRARSLFAAETRTALSQARLGITAGSTARRSRPAGQATGGAMG